MRTSLAIAVATQLAACGGEPAGVLAIQLDLLPVRGAAGDVFALTHGAVEIDAVADTGRVVVEDIAPLEGPETLQVVLHFAAGEREHLPEPGAGGAAHTGHSHGVLRAAHTGDGQSFAPSSLAEGLEPRHLGTLAISGGGAELRFSSRLAERPLGAFRAAEIVLTGAFDPPPAVLRGSVLSEP